MIDGVFGELRNDQGHFVGDTLEHAYSKNGGWEPKVPAGKYVCVRHAPKHLSYETFLLTNVPGAEGILIHRGNTEADSEGCILLGTSRQGTSITHSKEAFEKLMALQQGCSSFMLTVVEL